MSNRPTILFHVSDVHFGVEDRGALDWFASAVADEKPNAVVCTGDLTQRATNRQYDDARDWFMSLGVPVMVQPGNHDMPYYNPWERFRRPYARFGAMEAAVGKELSFDHAIIVPLDTNARAQWRWPWSDGIVKEKKLAPTLARIRELGDDERVKLVACHHPLLPDKDESANPTINGDAAFARLAEAGADAVLTGHVHVPFDMDRSRGNRSMRMIGAGTLSTRLRGADPSYNVVTIAADKQVAVERRNRAPTPRP